jgi:hypothetical protein
LKNIYLIDKITLKNDKSQNIHSFKENKLLKNVLPDIEIAIVLIPLVAILTSFATIAVLQWTNSQNLPSSTKN